MWGQLIVAELCLHELSHESNERQVILLVTDELRLR